MLVSGSPSAAMNDVELVDLSGQERICRKPQDFLGATESAVGAFVQGKAIVCGGYSYTNDCYFYNPGNGKRRN